MTAALILWMLVKAALAPATALGLLMDLAFGNMTGEEAWLWLENNEWFCLSMVAHMIAFVGWLEFVE